MELWYPVVGDLFFLVVVVGGGRRGGSCVPFAEFLGGLRWGESVLFGRRHHLDLVDSDVCLGDVLVNVDLLADGESVLSVGRRLNLGCPLERVVVGEVRSPFEWHVEADIIWRWAQIRVQHWRGHVVWQICLFRKSELWSLKSVLRQMCLRWAIRWNQVGIFLELLLRLQPLESVRVLVGNIFIHIFRPVVLVIKLQRAVLRVPHVCITRRNRWIFIRCVTLAFVIVVAVERWEHLPVAIDVTRAARWHLENVHVQTAGRVPAEQSVVVVDLDATRPEVVSQVSAAVLGSSVGENFSFEIYFIIKKIEYNA